MSASRFMEDVALIQVLSNVRIIDVLIGSDEPAGGVLPSPTVSTSVPSELSNSIFSWLLDNEMAVVTSCMGVATIDFVSSCA